MSQAQWISEADVVSLMHLGEAIDALEAGLRLEASGEALNMVKTHAVWGGGHTLHAIGAAFPGGGFIGTKSWGHTAAGATPLLILWDSETGDLKAVIEAFALGQMRTGAMSGVATRWLAAAGADELAIIGSGKQALTQAAAIALVRPLKRVRVHSPTPEHRAQFVQRLERKLAIEAVNAASVEDAVAGAPIVTCVTRARQAFLRADMLAHGAHVNAVGAISAEREEVAADVFPRCGVVAGDSIPGIQKASKEFIGYYADGPGEWADMRPISTIVAAGTERPAAADLTLFKAMGMGISDLSLGMKLYARAVETGAGRVLPQPERAAVRLNAQAR